MRCCCRSCGCCASTSSSGWCTTGKRSSSRTEPTQTNTDVRLALAVSAATGFVERVFLKRSLVVANGSALLGKVARLGADQARMCKVVSSTLRALDMPAIVRRQRRDALRPTVLYVGRISVEKGLVDLLSAIPEIKERCENAGAPRPFFRLVGWGAHGEEERLKGQVEALGLAGDVEFTGRVPFGPRLFETYKTASLCVLPSWPREPHAPSSRRWRLVCRSSRPVWAVFPT